MSLKIIYFFLMALFLNMEAAYAAENEYGIVSAWFNEENATVEDINMKIGEPATIKVTVTSKINGHIFIELSEPGITKGFDVLRGPSKEDESIDNYDINSGWTQTLTWTVSPNGAWKNGNAPINIFVQFNKIENGKLKGDKKIQFTIANPYILDEQYNGIISTPKLTSSPTVTTSPSPAKATPFPHVLFTVSILILAWCWRH